MGCKREPELVPEGIRSNQVDHGLIPEDSELVHADNRQRGRRTRAEEADGNEVENVESLDESLLRANP